MKKIISVRNLNFSYGDKRIFNDFSMEIKKGDFVTLIGPNGSGKSTLIRILLGFLKTDGEVMIDELIMDHQNIKKIITKIGVVFENPDNQFVAETVMDDIAFSLENMQVNSKEIKKRIEEIGKYLEIEDIMMREPHTLSGGQKQLVSLASALVIEPEILILDEALTMVDLDIREKIYEILKKVNKEKGITILNVTHEMEEILYGNTIIVIDDGKIVTSGPTKKVIQEEKTFNRLGLALPFMAELSIKLKYYGLIDDIIIDMGEMVNKLWK